MTINDLPTPERVDELIKHWERRLANHNVFNSDNPAVKLEDTIASLREYLRVITRFDLVMNDETGEYGVKAIRFVKPRRLPTPDTPST